MAHDTYNLMISLSLDGLLEEAEERDLRQHIQTCNMCADMWDRMSLVNTMFTTQAVLMTPSPNFTMMVMARVDGYQARRRWYPWLVASLAVTSLIAGLNIVLPMLFFAFELYKPMLEWPVVGTVLGIIAQGLAWLQMGADFAASTLNGWFTLLTTDPVTLATVLSALVLASIWIGLREGVKSMATAPSQQSA